MVALIIGVIVAGLGIGALISAFQNRGTIPELGATSAPAVTPIPQPRAPSPRLTLPPTPSPSPVPSRSPAPSPSPAPSAVPSPVPSPSPPAKPSPTPQPTPTAGPTATPLPSTAPATSAPTPAASVKPATVAPPPTARPTFAPSPALAATALVRRYIDDLIGGDEAGAYAALGGTSSDRSLDLKEEAFLDKDARITSIRASRTDATGTTVDAEITSGRGSYVATFHVVNGPGGVIINQHDYIKI
jgi:hypothetical protein